MNTDSTRFFWNQEKHWIVSNGIRRQRRQNRELVIDIVPWRRSRAFIDADMPSTTETHFSQCRGPDVLLCGLRHQTRYQDSAMMGSTITELRKLVEAIRSVGDSIDGDPRPQIDQVAPRLRIRSFPSRPISTCSFTQGSPQSSNHTVRTEASKTLELCSRLV